MRMRKAYYDNIFDLNDFRRQVDLTKSFNVKIFLNKILCHENFPISGTCTVLDIKKVENAFFHSMYIFSVIINAIDKHDI